MLSNGHYWQPLGLVANAPIVITPQHQFNSIIYRFGFELEPIKIQIWAKYSDSGDQLNFIAYLERVAGRPINSGSCSLAVYQVSGNNLWSDVSVDVVIPTKDSQNRWLASVNASDVITNLCMGKTTLRVVATMTRGLKTFKKEIYVNHLGIADAAAYFRSKILRLEAFKKDE